MALDTIIMLAGEEEAPVLTGLLRRHNPGLVMRTVHRRDDLDQAWREPLTGARLLSFCSNVIVPAALLDKLPGPGYNFHPGPPERPGRYPAVFALFEGAARFGVTVHEMRPAVDSGPIVTAEWFDIAENCDLSTFESQTLTRLGEVFHRLAPYLATVTEPLPHLPVTWRGHKTTKAECETLCAITPGMDARAITLRQRCCGSLAKP